jgi:hypothetical protein
MPGSILEGIYWENVQKHLGFPNFSKEVEREII